MDADTQPAVITVTEPSPSTDSSGVVRHRGPNSEERDVEATSHPDVADSDTTGKDSNRKPGSLYYLYVLRPARLLLHNAELLIWTLLFLFVVFVILRHRSPPAQLHPWNKPVHQGLDYETKVRREALGLGPPQQSSLRGVDSDSGGGASRGLDWHEEQNDFLDKNGADGFDDAHPRHHVDVDHLGDLEWKKKKQSAATDNDDEQNTPLYNDDNVRGQFDDSEKNYYQQRDNEAPEGDYDELEKYYQNDDTHSYKYYSRRTPAPTRPPLSLSDIKRQIRRLEMNEEFSIVKLRIKELDELKKQRQRLLDEYDFADEQDAFREKEREWQRLKWNEQEKKFQRWLQRSRWQSSRDEVALPPSHSGGKVVATVGDDDDCPDMRMPYPFQPYAQHLQNTPDASYAYATYVSSAEFVPAAATLMHSIAFTGSQYARVICITEDISQRDRDTLSVLGQVVVIDKVPSPRYIDNPRYRETFTKLRIWQLAQYSRVLYIDTDVVVTRNMDDLFDIGEWAVPMDAEQNRYSTGMMVCEPSLATFDQMMTALQTTTTSMELPDLLFLKAYFDNPEHHKRIHIIPRWYQVYQEEFGSMYSSYLTNRKQKLTIFDTRIHGIHYPGAGKPWGSYATKLAKYKPHFCHWRSADVFQYEPQFLWYVHHELMLRSLAAAKQSSLFDFEHGGAVVKLSQWVEEKKKKDEEESSWRNRWSSPYSSYNNNNRYGTNSYNNKQTADGASSPATTTTANDFEWVYENGGWKKVYRRAADGPTSSGNTKGTTAGLTTPPVGGVGIPQDETQMWQLVPGSCRFVLTKDLPRVLLSFSEYQAVTPATSTATPQTRRTAFSKAAEPTTAVVDSASKASSAPRHAKRMVPLPTSGFWKQDAYADLGGDTYNRAPSSESAADSTSSSASDGTALLQQLEDDTAKQSSSSSSSSSSSDGYGHIKDTSSSSSASSSGSDGSNNAASDAAQKEDQQEVDTNAVYDSTVPPAEDAKRIQEERKVRQQMEANADGEFETYRRDYTSRRNPYRSNNAAQRRLQQIFEEDESDPPSTIMYRRRTAAPTRQNRRAPPQADDDQEKTQGQPDHLLRRGRYNTHEHNVSSGTFAKDARHLPRRRAAQPDPVTDSADYIAGAYAPGQHRRRAAQVDDAVQRRRSIRPTAKPLRDTTANAEGSQNDPNPMPSMRHSKPARGQLDDHRNARGVVTPAAPTVHLKATDDYDQLSSEPHVASDDAEVLLKRSGISSLENNNAKVVDIVKTGRRSKVFDDVVTEKQGTVRARQLKDTAGSSFLEARNINSKRATDLGGDELPQSRQRGREQSIPTGNPSRKNTYDSGEDDSRSADAAVRQSKKALSEDAEQRTPTKRIAERRAVGERLRPATLEKKRIDAALDDTHRITMPQEVVDKSFNAKQRRGRTLDGNSGDAKSGVELATSHGGSNADEPVDPIIKKEHPWEQKKNVDANDEALGFSQSTDDSLQRMVASKIAGAASSEMRGDADASDQQQQEPQIPKRVANKALLADNRKKHVATTADDGYDAPLQRRRNDPAVLDDRRKSDVASARPVDEGDATSPKGQSAPPEKPSPTKSSHSSGGKDPEPTDDILMPPASDDSEHDGRPQAQTSMSSSSVSDADAAFLSLLDNMVAHAEKKLTLSPQQRIALGQLDPEASTNGPMGRVNAAAVTGEVVQGATIDFSLVPPFVASLPQVWADTAPETYEWVVSWCTKSKLRPSKTAACGKAAHVTQYSVGLCRTNFDESFEVLPIYAPSATDVSGDKLTGDQLAVSFVEPFSGERTVEPPLPSVGANVKESAAPQNKRRVTSSPAINKKLFALAQSDQDTPSNSDDGNGSVGSLPSSEDSGAAPYETSQDTSTNSPPDTSTTSTRPTRRRIESVAGMAGVVFRSKVTLDLPMRVKWFEVRVRCDAMMSPHTVALDDDRTFVPRVVVNNSHPPHGRTYHLHLRSRCACLGGCDSFVNTTVAQELLTRTQRHAGDQGSPSKKANSELAQKTQKGAHSKLSSTTAQGSGIASLNITEQQTKYVWRLFESWKRKTLGSRRSSAHVCESHGSDADACVASPLCQYIVDEKRCTVDSTKPWIRIHSVAQHRYCNCTHVGGDAERRRATVADCQDEARRAGANVINFVAPPAAQTLPPRSYRGTQAPSSRYGETAYQQHRGMNAPTTRPPPTPAKRTSFGCFYKRCMAASLLSGTIPTSRYVPGDAADGLVGFDVYFLNPFVSNESTPTNKISGGELRQDPVSDDNGSDEAQALGSTPTPPWPKKKRAPLFPDDVQ